MLDSLSEPVARYLKALVAIPQALGPELDATAVIEAAAVQILDASPMTAVSILLLDQATQRLHHVLSRGQGEGILAGRECRAGDSSLCGQAVGRKEATHVEELDRHDPESPQLQATGFGSLSLVPIVSAAGVIGLIVVGGPRGALGPGECVFLEAIGAQLGVGLENVGLLSEVVAAANEWTATFEAMEDLIAIFDGQGRLITLNRALAQKLGLDQEAVDPQSCEELANGELCGHDQQKCIIKEALEKKEPRTAERDSPVLGGRHLITASPLPHGGAVLVARDVSPIHELEAARAEARRQEHIRRFQSAFVAEVSHQFRTPLHGVISTAEMLADGLFGDLSPDQLDAVKDILASGRRLERLFNDLLDLTKLDAGKLALTKTTLPLLGVIEAAMTQMAPRAEARGVKLVLKPQPQPCLLVADQGRVRQIIASLLHRAIDRTPSGGEVEIEAGLADGQVRILVSDPGRPQEEAEHDLSLTLARRLADLHGGGLEWLPAAEGQKETAACILPQEDLSGQDTGR